MSTASIFVPRLDTRSTSDSNANYLNESRPETIINFTSTEAQMIKEAKNHLGESMKYDKPLYSS